MAGYIGSKTSVTQVDGYNRTEADAEFVNDPNGAITVDGSNNVGIGTSSPGISGGYTSLALNNSTNSGWMQLMSGGTSVADWYSSGGTENTLRSLSGGFTFTVSGASDVKFNINSSERMRLDSSGNLLVGLTSSTDGTNAGVRARADGFLAATREGSATQATAYFNKKTNDGDIVGFYKDGSTVGSIGSNNGNIKVSAFGEEYAALSGTTPTVDCRSGNNFALSTTGNTTFTFSNPPTSGTAFGFTLKVTAGGTHTLTWPSSVDWAGGSAPDAPASGETNVLVFITHDGGTTWYGFQAGAALA